MNKSPVLLSKFLLLMMMQWPKLGKSRLYLKLPPAGSASTLARPEDAPDLGRREPPQRVLFRGSKATRTMVSITRGHASPSSGRASAPKLTVVRRLSSRPWSLRRTEVRLPTCSWTKALRAGGKWRFNQKDDSATSPEEPSAQPSETAPQTGSQRRSSQQSCGVAGRKGAFDFCTLVFQIPERPLPTAE